MDICGLGCGFWGVIGRFWDRVGMHRLQGNFLRNGESKVQDHGT